MENFETYRLEQTGQQTQAILDQVSTNTADIAQLRALYEALTQSEPIIIQPSDTWPVADPQENVIYRVIDRVNTPPQSYSDYMWNGTAMVLMATYNNAIDNEPTPGSNNLVKSGGVAASIVFDISAYHATGSTLATYANLAAALGTDGANVPASVRKGGMSVKFVKSSDNKYVQARCMAQNFTTDVTQWQVVEDEPMAGSNNLVKSGGVANLGQGIKEIVTDYDAADNPILGKYIIADGSRLADSSDYDTTEMCIVKEGEKWLFIAKNSSIACNLWGYSDNNRSNPTQLISAPFNTERNEEITIPSGVKFIQGFGVTSTLTSTHLSLKPVGNLYQRVVKLESDNLQNTSDIAQLRTDVDSILSEEEIDLFESQTLNSYITPSGTVASANGWCVSEFHKTEHGKIWLYTGKSTASGLSTVWGYSDANRNGATPLTPAETGTWTNLEIVIPNGINYIQAQATMDVNRSFVNVIEDGVIELFYDSTKGTFRSFLANNVINPDKNKRYIIYVAAGTYDIGSEITPEEISGGTFIGITIPNYTTIKGSGKDVTVFTCNISSGNISTLNLQKTASLENLTVIGENCRYAVHDDFSQNNDKTQRKIKNCKFVSNQCSYGYAYGSGCRSGQEWYFENCEFIGNTYEDGGFAIHSNTGFTIPTSVIFINCVFKSFGGHPERALDIRGLGTSNAIINNLQLIGCSWDGIRLIGVSLSYYDWEITGTTNRINNSVIVQGTTTYFPKFIEFDSYILSSVLVDRNGEPIELNEINSETGQYLAVDGSVVNHPNYAITDYIDIFGVKNLIYNGRITENTVVVSCAFYDSSKKFISAVAPSVTYQTTQSIVIPSGTRYVRFCASKYSNMFFVTCNLPINERLQRNIKNLNNIISNKSDKNYNFYRTFFSSCICIGDSVTQGHIYDYPRTPTSGSVISAQSYPAFLQKITDWSIENGGVSGYTALQWWQNKAQTYQYSSYELALIELGLNGHIGDDLNSSTFDGSEWEPDTAYIVGEKKMYNGLGYKCIEAHTSGSIFDSSKWTYAYPDYEDNNTGSYCKIIEYAKIQNPNIVVILIISPYWSYINSDLTPNNIFAVAQRYGLEIIDLRDTSYINLNDFKFHGLGGDNQINMVHFNAIGYCTKAGYIYKKIGDIVFEDAKEINSLHPLDN